VMVSGQSSIRRTNFLGQPISSPNRAPPCSQSLNRSRSRRGFGYFNVCLSLSFLRVNQGKEEELLILPGFRQRTKSMRWVGHKIYSFTGGSGEKKMRGGAWRLPWASSFLAKASASL
jgi:hypothetical protein